MWEYVSNEKLNELYHFGVIGMKWGIHKGNVSGTYAKASKKLNKLDSEIAKATKKSDKQYDKTMKHPSSQKAQKKYKESQAKVMQKTYKAKKWVTQMEGAFSKTSQKLSKQQIQMGKNYAASLERNRELSYYLR